MKTTTAQEKIAKENGTTVSVRPAPTMPLTRQNCSPKDFYGELPRA